MALKIRYSDKKYLCKYNLNVDFFESIGLNVKDLWPTRNVYILETDRGKKILKIIDYNDDKLEFIDSITEYIKKKYPYVLNINKFNGKNFLIDNGNKYIVMDLIEGIECNLANPIDLKDASRGLAMLHCASKGIMDVISEKYKETEVDLFNLKDEMIKNKNMLEVLKNKVSEYVYKNEFDNFFIEEVDYNIEQINQCIKLLENSEYEKLCNDEDAIALCHNDLAYHNILMKDNQAHFIDFDYSKIDLKVKDISTFINKTGKKFGYDIEICSNIIKEYNSVTNIKKSEYDLIYVYLKFPKDFCNATKEYYFKRKDWTYDSYLSKFINKLEYKKEKEILLEYILKNIIN